MAYKPKPSAYDTSAFTFTTPVSTLKEALVKCHAELEDLLEYVSPDAEQKKRIRDLMYWLGVWEITLPKVEANKVDTVQTCAIENRVLGLYTGSKKGKKKK